MNSMFFRSLLKRMGPHLGALLLLATVASGFYAKSFDGFDLRQGDIEQHKGMSKEINDFRGLTEKRCGWTGAMFAGMPTDQISKAPDRLSLSRRLNVLVGRVFNASPSASLFIAMLAAYLLAIALGATPMVSLICAVAFGLSTINIMYLGAGHNSKVRTIAFLPGVMAGVLWAFRRNLWQGAALAAIFTTLVVSAGHPQMVYYLLFLMVAVGLTEVIGLVRESRDWNRIFKTIAWLSVAGIVGVLPSANGLLETKEYSKYTTRGDQVLQVDSEVVEGGLETDYVLEYSMASGEWWAMMCPDFKGGNNPLYWGEQAFSAAPFYFGAVACLFFVLFLFAGRDRLKWPLLLVAVLAVFLSRRAPSALMGFFLEYVPFYSKFRDTKMMLVLVQVSVIIGVALGLKELIALVHSSAEDRVKSIRRWAGGFLGLMGLFGCFFAFPESFFDFQSFIRPDVAVEQLGLSQAIDLRVEIFRADILRTLALWFVSGLLVAAWLKGWLRTSWALVALAVLSFGDQWTVDRRYSNEAKTQGGQFINWVKKVDAKFPFSPTPAMMAVLELERPRHPEMKEDAEQLLRDYEAGLGEVRLNRMDKERLSVIAEFGALRFLDHYRVLQWGSPFNEAKTSYFFQSVGGYHGAKLRRYSDYYERVLAQELYRFADVLNKGGQVTDGLRELVTLRMLNTKYILIDDNSAPMVLPDPNGVAWVADDWGFAKSPDEELEAVAAMRDPKDVIIHSEFEPLMEGLVSGARGVVELSSYEPDLLDYEVNLDRDGLVVFSEIWYPAGWKAEIDGELTEPIRVNYVLRGLRVPAGTHNVRWYYEKSSTAGWSALWNGLLLLFVGFGFWRGRKVSTDTMTH